MVSAVSSQTAARDYGDVLDYTAVSLHRRMPADIIFVTADNEALHLVYNRLINVVCRYLLYLSTS